jgi:hypothetical protein
MHFPAYLAFTHPLTLYRLLKNNGGFDARFFLRVIILFLVSWVLLPFDVLEKILYGKQIAEKKISDSPLIILGHDRSGTTHLLNLMSLDPQFSYTRPSQMVLPGCCILFDKLLDFLLGKLDYRRPFDNMEVGPGSPQDDEVPMVKLTPHCEYHKYSFPRNYKFWLDTYVFNFSEQSPFFDEWKNTYLGTLRKAAVLMKRDRPLLKSPATMANLNVILKLFPDAKFIHIKRNPHKVIPSQINLHKVMVEKYGLESVTDEEIKDFALYQYKGYMEGYLRDRPLIPEQNLIEISYEDFVRDRMAWLRAIYEKLELGSFTERETSLQNYIASIENYERHNFAEDPVLKARIDNELAFAFDALGYARC